MSREDKEAHVKEYMLNGEAVAILVTVDPRTGSNLCVDATRAFGGFGRLIIRANEEVGEGNVNALSAIIGGQLRVGFISVKSLEAGEAVVCGQVGYKSFILLSHYSTIINIALCNSCQAAR